MLAAPGGDGSITSAVSVVNRAGGARSRWTPRSSATTRATKTLTWTGSTPLPEGYYELRLRTDLLKDSEGEPIWGTTSGLVFSPVFAAMQNVQAAGADLAVDGYSGATLADWNADGLADLLVGERTADGLGKLRVYLNSGTAQSPQFDAFFYAQAGGGDLTVPGGDGFGVSARLADWDGDGLKDLVARSGRWAGRVLGRCGGDAGGSSGRRDGSENHPTWKRANRVRRRRSTWAIRRWSNWPTGTTTGGWTCSSAPRTAACRCT